MIGLLCMATGSQAGTVTTFYGTAAITSPTNMPAIDLAFELDVDGTTVLPPTSYIILEKTMLFPMVGQVDGKDVGPRIQEGTVGTDTFSLTSQEFDSQAGNKTVKRQITLDNATVSNDGNSVTGIYTETVTDLLPQTFTISGNFVLMRPMSDLEDPIIDEDNDNCFDLDEIRAAGMDNSRMEYSDAAAALSILNNGGSLPICAPGDETVRNALIEFYEDQD